MNSSPSASLGQLPRLLYLGDVPVECSYHGSALLYRLLQNYPPEKLRIVETDLHGSLAERRLAGVTYAHSPPRAARFLNTRFNQWVSSALVLFASRRAKTIPDLLAGFRPEAVLAVAHAYGWLTAAQFAQDRNLPLHLIVHDDWPRITSVKPLLRSWLDGLFTRIYRQAASRLCVSPFMAKRYADACGLVGDVLYPSRAKDAPVFPDPPAGLASAKSALRVAFAGTLNTSDYARTLNCVAKQLVSSGGRVSIYGPGTPEDASRMGLDQPNIELRGLVPSGELIRRLRQEADVLLVPMSFAAGDESAMAVNFPSKLADYTAAALPLLVIGPETSSAVQWARENQDVALVLNRRDEGLIKDALLRLTTDGELRQRLGAKAGQVGARLFSAEAARELFLRKLAGALA